MTTLLQRIPTKLVKASEGENSHTHRLVGEKGADRLVPVPTGITVSVQGGAKLGNTLTNFFLYHIIFIYLFFPFIQEN